MKNAIQYKAERLHPNSQAHAMFVEWKKETDTTRAKALRNKLDSHLKEVNAKYEACFQNNVS